MTTIEATLEGIRIGQPTVVGSVLLFPLLEGRAGARDYVCCADAIEAGLLDVREHEQAMVHEVVVHNVGNVPVLLVEGELLIGLRQDRAVNISVLCPVDSTIRVPVSCVEAGRWGDDRSVSRARSRAPLALRDHLIRSVTQSVETDGSRRSDQHAVWSEVEALAERVGATSATSALNGIAAQMLDVGPEGDRDLRPSGEQRGVAVVLGGEVRAVDLFDRPETLMAHWDALVAACRMEASYGPGNDAHRAGEEAVRAVLKDLARAEATTRPGIGLGSEHYLRHDTLVGHALEWDGTVVHLSAVLS